ncbi:hypothetical protein OEB99_12710 [Actinotalea sp. M2MS4P-6]|uniref:hypothetical protein n=1 Tax=Actinotalea sp. M2MS4P-6 TaxID=2983762 RepID=UPI0021E500B1|nr:hypothetical protein [Actinotalea sp. M2MS4P-6]MCV2395171.1 hypothetical protein [Actinotalea sp. M2MS4P-6]
MMRVLTGCAAAVVLVVAGSGSASAAENDPPIPADVAAYYESQALVDLAEVSAERVVRTSEAVGERDATAAASSVGVIHAVHAFSEGFGRGEAGAAPTEPDGEWIAALKDGDEVIGTFRVWKPAGGPAEMAAYDDNVELGLILEQTGYRVVVEDGGSGELFAIDGDVVVSLNQPAKVEFGNSQRISNFRAAYARRAARGRAAASSMDAPVGWALVGAEPRISTWYLDPVLMGGAGLGVCGAAFGAFLLISGRRRLAVGVDAGDASDPPLVESA